MVFLKLILLILPAIVFGQEGSKDCPVIGAPVVSVPKFTQSCRPNTQKRQFVLPMGVDEKADESMCECVDSSNEWKTSAISTEVKGQYTGDGFLDKSFRDAVRNDFKDLVSTFTKFNNYMLTKDHLGNIIDENAMNAAGGLCNFKSIKADVKDMYGKVGSGDCPAGKDLFEDRVSDVFDTNFPEMFDDSDFFLRTNNDSRALMSPMGSDVIKASCVTFDDMKKYRSSTGAQEELLAEMLRVESFSEFQDYMSASHRKPQPVFSSKDKIKDILSYNPIFNLAFKDKKFFDELRNHLKQLSDEKKPLTNVFQTKAVNSVAFNALNETCLNFTRNLKKLLCSEKPAKLNPAMLNNHLSNVYDSTPLDRATQEALTDVMTSRYSCNYPSGVHDNQFEEYLAQAIKVANNTKNVEEQGLKKNDTVEFSKSFCRQGERFEPLTQEDLAGLTKKYAEQLKAKGIKLDEMFKNPELVAKLGVKIDLSKTPFEFTSVEEGKLPSIGHDKWNDIAPLFLKKGMSVDDLKQLYTLMEMQINKRSSDVSDLHAKLVKEDAVFERITDAQIASILSGKAPPAGVSDEQLRLLAIRNSAQKSDQNMDLNYAQEMFFGDRDLKQVKNEGALYTKNSSTYDNTYQSRLTGAPQSDIKWGQTSFDNKPVEKVNLSQSEASQMAAPTTASQFNNNIQTERTAQRQIQDTGYINPGAMSGSGSTVSRSPSSSGSSSSLPTSFDSSSDSQGSRDSRANQQNGFKPGTGSTQISNELKQLQDEFNRGQKNFEQVQKAYRNMKSSPTMAGAGSVTSGNRSSNAVHPKNLPVKNLNGDYYTPESNGSELSSKSASSNQPQSHDSGQKQASTGGPLKSSGASAGVGGDDMGAIANTSSLPGMEGRRIASVQAPKLSSFEYDKYIPHSIIDIVGSVDKVVMIFGLEGKSFKTIEAIETMDKATQKVEINYFEREFDFVPAGEFVTMKDEFINKDKREKAYNTYFIFPRTKANLLTSKRYAKGTREVSKKAVTKDYVMGIQNDILSDDTIKVAINKSLDLFK